MAKDNTAKVWEKLNEDLGTEGFFRGDEKVKMNLEVVPFPSVSLGAVAGSWGLPISGGKLTEFFGAEGCGKTLLSMLMVRETQVRHPGSEVLWADSENSFSKPWAKQLQIDLSKVRFLSTNDAVKIWDALIGRYNKDGKKTRPGALDLAAAGDLDIKLVVLDSIADLSVPIEQGRNAEEQEMAPLARFLPRFLRALKPALVKANTGMIAINHLRDNMQGGQSAPGGRHYRHSCDLRVKLHASQAADATLLDERGEKCGHRILATIAKTRFGASSRQTEFWLDFRKGIVKVGEETAMLGAGYGVIQRPNNKTWVYGDKSIVGKENFFKMLDENEILRAEIVEKVKKAHEDGFDGKIEVVSEQGPADDE